jgi:hypothetical protein
MEPWMLQAFIIGLVGVVGYLLRQKDVEQAKSISMLFHKHDEDAERLNRFELRIAQEHYVKPELDSRFEKLETTIKEAMNGLGIKFDELSKLLIAHIIKEDNRKDHGNQNTN